MGHICPTHSCMDIIYYKHNKEKSCKHKPGGFMLKTQKTTVISDESNLIQPNKETKDTECTSMQSIVYGKFFKKNMQNETAFGEDKEAEIIDIFEF
jgi:hypothetical protein